MASALQKLRNISKLAMKRPIWQPWHRKLNAVNSRKRNIDSCCVADVQFTVEKEAPLNLCSLFKSITLGTLFQI